MQAELEKIKVALLAVLASQATMLSVQVVTDSDDAENVKDCVEKLVQAADYLITGELKECGSGKA